MAGPDHTTLRTAARVAARVLGIAIVGAVLGLVVGCVTPAKVEVAGSDTSLWLEFGRNYDQFGVDGVLSLRRATSRSVLGEPIGVHADVHLDAAELTDSAGGFNVNVLPAYVQAYSDPAQLIDSLKRALITHFLVFALLGAGVGVLAWGGHRGYRAWRARYDREHWPDPLVREAARSYRRPERRGLRRAAVAVVMLAAFDAVPSGAFAGISNDPVTGEEIFAGTPLAGVEVSGLLRPAVLAAENYIETYFEQTNTYYDQLRTALDDYLTADPIELPGGDTTVHLGLVSDRHCNIGMDRVVVDLLKHFGVKTLVSSGDDAFSGSFGFEAACTRNLAEKTARAGITDVFVGGNHDSPQTIADEADQHIVTLTDSVVEKNGLRFVGIPDPRTSRYGEGIQPSSNAAQAALLKQQGTAAGALACKSDGPIIAVLHDPAAGMMAMQQGCGKITLALDGHTHKEAGPVPVELADGGTGYQFTSGSTGGAPTESAIESTFASRLTVGPLNHPAWVNIVSVDRDTGELVGVTAFTFTPDQQITVTQQLP